MDQVRQRLRSDHDVDRTEPSYSHWILRDIRYFGGKPHPNRLGTQEVARFLSHLATESKVSASTQRPAVNALVFLSQNVLHPPLAGKIAPVRSKRQLRVPTVLTQEEVQRLLAAMTGQHAGMARLLYGAGLRRLECIRLRRQDVAFGQPLLVVQGGKGGKDRTTILPRNLREEWQAPLEAVKARHHQDLEEGSGRVQSAAAKG